MDVVILVFNKCKSSYIEKLRRYHLANKFKFFSLSLTINELNYESIMQPIIFTAKAIDFYQNCQLFEFLREAYAAVWIKKFFLWLLLPPSHIFFVSLHLMSYKCRTYLIYLISFMLKRTKTGVGFW